MQHLLYILPILGAIAGQVQPAPGQNLPVARRVAEPAPRAMPPARESPVAKISGPVSPVPPHTMVKLSSLNSVGDGFAWLSFSRGLSGGQLPGGREFWFTGPPGDYQVALIVSANNVLATDQVVITIGTPGPTPPTPPVPPTPPTPGTSPIAVDGLAVLIVYETKDASKMPIGHSAAIYGKEVRDYLRAKCAADPDEAGWKAFRIWDPDIALDNVGKAWQDAMKRQRTSVPWLIVSNPKMGGGFEGPLPMDLEETMKILKQFGG